MNDERPARRLEEIFASLGQTSYGYLLHDDERRRHLLATIMAESSDRIVREMGQQLRDGQASLGQLLSVPDYAEALSGGPARLAELDFDQIAEQVDEVRQREHEDADAVTESDGVPRRPTPPR